MGKTILDAVWDAVILLTFAAIVVAGMSVCILFVLMLAGVP
jgi:hypothetical protein